MIHVDGTYSKAANVDRRVAELYRFFPFPVAHLKRRKRSVGISGMLFVLDAQLPHCQCKPGKLVLRWRGYRFSRRQFVEANRIRVLNSTS